MQTFRINDEESKVDYQTISLESSQHKLEMVKVSLNKTKSKLDPIYEKYSYASKVMKSFDPFTREKYALAKKINAGGVTNAWLKGYELIESFQLVDRQSGRNFVYFDNASFPGSFILAANHYINTKTKIANFHWYGSSLLHNDALNDTYGLYKKYPDHWMMNDANDGDISKWDNIQDFQKQMAVKEGITRSVNLYTCDLGIDSSGDFNNQEKIHSYLNICQLYCGLSLLKNGGNMAVKHFTIFEPFTISYLALLPALFQQVYICKPLSSKRTNSEVYIVCKGFTYPFTREQQHVYDLFTNSVKNKNMTPMPCEYPQSYNDVIQASYQLFAKQTTSLKNYVYSMKSMISPIDSRRCENALNRTNRQIRAKFDKLNIKRIHKNDNLF